MVSYHQRILKNRFLFPLLTLHLSQICWDCSDIHHQVQTKMKTEIEQQVQIKMNAEQQVQSEINDDQQVQSTEIEENIVQHMYQIVLTDHDTLRCSKPKPFHQCHVLLSILL